MATEDDRPRFWDNPNYNIPDESNLNPPTKPEHRMKPEFWYHGPGETNRKTYAKIKEG